MILLTCLLMCAAALVAKMNINKLNRPTAILVRVEKHNAEKQYGRRIN